eukprot:360708-Chlamydomonas_euryale.AAC.4
MALHGHRWPDMMMAIWPEKIYDVVYCGLSWAYWQNSRKPAPSHLFVPAVYAWAAQEAGAPVWPCAGVSSVKPAAPHLCAVHAGAAGFARTGGERRAPRVPLPCDAG